MAYSACALFLYSTNQEAPYVRIYAVVQIHTESGTFKQLSQLLYILYIILLTQEFIWQDTVTGELKYSY